MSEELNSPTAAPRKLTSHEPASLWQPGVIPRPRRSARTVVLAGRYGLIHLTGELDVATAPDVRHAVRDSLTRPPALLRIDISAVSFCDCAGLGALLWAKAEAARAGSGFHLSGPFQPIVARVLDATGASVHLGLESRPVEQCHKQEEGRGRAADSDTVHHSRRGGVARRTVAR
ncbi:STAS domain-containing protein [Streptomyces sp. NPDC054865]